MEALIAEKQKRHEEELAKVNEQLTAAQLETKKQADEWEKYKEQAERQRKQDEAEKKTREEELEAAKQHAFDADLDKIQIVLGALEALQEQAKDADKEKEEMLAKMTAEWGRKEAQM